MISKEAQLSSSKAKQSVLDFTSLGKGTVTGEMKIVAVRHSLHGNLRALTMSSACLPAHSTLMARLARDLVHADAVETQSAGEWSASMTAAEPPILLTVCAWQRGQLPVALSSCCS
jgi:hypothetical protein